ncbi:hypothetical protein E2C01_097533 [Portunus trituberculatus]|uniref:Uncharacterized protein n=1 Tax=Portunus trituberculatus TaxID=210409 RepID=A0A5B7K4N9_PORTR|nr:hypothetical protein [Portunus trituberculatus]
MEAVLCRLGELSCAGDFRGRLANTSSSSSPTLPPSSGPPPSFPGTKAPVSHTNHSGVLYLFGHSVDVRECFASKCDRLSERYDAVEPKDTMKLVGISKVRNEMVQCGN